MTDAGEHDFSEAGAMKSLRKGSSVSELVRSYDDGAGKRDRSESGDSTSAPTGKRRPPDSSPRQTTAEVKELIADAVEGIEERLSVFLSKELHDFEKKLQSKFDALHARIKDLEEHVNDRDQEMEKMAAKLKKTEEEVRSLHERSEKSEMNARIPCLVFSGRAMAPLRGPRLAAPLRPTDRSASLGSGPAGSAGPSGPRAAGSGAPDGGGGGPVGSGGGREVEGGEDINQLVIDVLQSRFQGLSISSSDIDRAHRLPGPNNRVIVRFVRSGSGSVRDQLMSRRMELWGRNDLFINESLTTLKGQIHRALLDAKKAGKLYTVYSR